MTGVICLQGGREFTTECREMDAEVLRLAGSDRVAVLAGAARVGSDYFNASSRARLHYEALGATVVVIPDPRDDVDAALDGLTVDLSLIVLPGGSPTSLREVLSGPVGQRVVEIHQGGVTLSGASAGAMVLCTRMVQPGRQAEVVPGLGLVDGRSRLLQADDLITGDRYIFVRDAYLSNREAFVNDGVVSDTFSDFEEGEDFEEF